MTTITVAYRTDITAAVTRNDGRGTAAIITLDVVVRFPPVEPATGVDDTLAEYERQWQSLLHWLAEYVNGRDLARTLDFEPTPVRLALYLARVRDSVFPSVETLTVGDDHTTYTVTP